MMKTKNPSGTIFTGTFLIRRICTETAPAAADKGSVYRRLPKFKSEPDFTKEVSLYRKLSSLRATGKSATQILEEYNREGVIFTATELGRCVESLRKFKNYPHALEVLEWMDSENIKLSVCDHARRLDLIARAKGITEAENYFENLSPSLQDTQTYGALLHNYCKEKMQDKALKLFKKMNELNMTLTTLNYDDIIGLHMKLGNFVNVFPMVDEMKRKNIPLSTFTYNVLMKSYAALNDIEAAELVLEEMEKEDKDKRDWTVYSNLAVIYVKAGLFKKAEAALQKVKLTMRYRDCLAYHFMISVYASTSNLSEVKRVWSTFKLVFPQPNNSSYLLIIQALSKFDDIDSLKQCYEEWKSSCMGTDMRIMNILIKSYLKHDMVKEAELLFEEFPKKGSKLLFTAREMFMKFFLKCKDIEMAMKHVEAAAFEKGYHYCSPEPELLTAFFTYYEEAKDVDSAERFCEILKEGNLINSTAYERLLQVYVAAGKSAPNMRRRNENEGIILNGEHE